MGYGVHVGWCIEGAIGSLQKIDCTYLSPHVELSDRLEAGSKIFLQPINLSHWFVQLLSPAARKFLRMVCRRCLQMFLVILV
jgi:class 3 adenylate cyclase